MKNYATCFAIACFVATLLGCSDNSPEQPAKPLSESEELALKGKNKARICAGCHGPAGISRVPSYPSLAGLSEEYLSKQLYNFRSGARDNPTMSSIAVNLSNEDIAALARHFASLPGEQRN